MTPRAAPVLAIAPSLTSHESGGIWTQPSRDLPSKMGLVALSTASGSAGGSFGLSSGGSAVFPAPPAAPSIATPHARVTVAHHETRIELPPGCVCKVVGTPRVPSATVAGLCQRIVSARGPALLFPSPSRGEGEARSRPATDALRWQTRLESPMAHGVCLLLYERTSDQLADFAEVSLDEELVAGQGAVIPDVHGALVVQEVEPDP